MATDLALDAWRGVWISCAETISANVQGLKNKRYDLRDTSAVLYQLSYQAIWELVTLWIRNILVDS